MKTQPTRPDDLEPGDVVVWKPVGHAVVKHVLVPTDLTPTSRIVEFTFGGRVSCQADEEFAKVVPPDESPDANESNLTVSFDPNDTDLVTVTFPFWGLSQTINIHPGPGWSSMAEVNDLIAKAVRDVLDAAFREASGMKIERES